MWPAKQAAAAPALVTAGLAVAAGHLAAAAAVAQRALSQSWLHGPRGPAAPVHRRAAASRCCCHRLEPQHAHASVWASAPAALRSEVAHMQCVALCAPQHHPQLECAAPVPSCRAVGLAPTSRDGCSVAQTQPPDATGNARSLCYSVFQLTQDPLKCGMSRCVAPCDASW